MMAALLINLCGNVTVMASQVNEVAGSVEGTEVRVTSKTGEELVFSKRGMNIKFCMKMGR